MAFTDFERLLKEAIGLDATSIGASAIQRAVMERTSACALADPDAYWQRVCSSSTELQALIEAVVVPETWFFRDRQAFSVLARVAIEEWLPAHPDGLLRVLSLPCSTGEEPYSIAMALLEAGVPDDRFDVDGIDISERALAHARSATYGKNSFRDHDVEFRARYFESTATGYRLSDRVRRRVRLQRGNLFVQDYAPSPTTYDAIFCRNLLIYFDRATQAGAIAVLERRLAANGVLFVAPSETGVLLNHNFAPVKTPFAFAFRKARAASSRNESVGGSLARRDRWPPAQAVTIPAAPHQPAPVPEAVSPGWDEQAGATAALREAAELANQGRLEDAVERCEHHLRRYGPSAETFHLLGLVRDASGDPRKRQRAIAGRSISTRIIADRSCIWRCSWRSLERTRRRRFSEDEPTACST
jgi:chemotaxis protein methyltransferase WspC